MKPWRFDLGYGIRVQSKHCPNCQFNVTNEHDIARAMEKRRAQLEKSVRVVAIGDGIGIRFPKEVVAMYEIKKGLKVTLKPSKKGVEILL